MQLPIASINPIFDPPQVIADLAIPGHPPEGYREYACPSQEPAVLAIQTLVGRCPELKQPDSEPDPDELRNNDSGCSSNGDVLKDRGQVDKLLAYAPPVPPCALG